MSHSIARLFSVGKHCLLICTMFLLSQEIFCQFNENSISQTSPDKQLNLLFRLHNGADIEYKVVYHQKEILGWSPLGLVAKTQPIPSGKISLGKIGRTTVNATFAWPLVKMQPFITNTTR